MNSAKKIVIAIVIIILIAAVIWVIYDKQKVETLDTNSTQNIVKNPNDGLGDLANAIGAESNIASGELKENKVEENEVVEPPTTDNSSEVVKEPTTNREEKAKQLVEKEWGDMEGFYLSVDGMDAQGRYRIIVRDDQTAQVAIYLVDVEKETVVEQ